MTALELQREDTKREFYDFLTKGGKDGENDPNRRLMLLTLVLD